MHPISNLEVLARMAYASSLETIGLDSEAKAEISDLRKEIEEEVFLDSHHPYFTFLLQERLLTAKRDSLELFESEEIHVAFQAIEKFSLLQKFRLACVIADGTFKKNASHALPQPSILLEIKDLPDDPLLKCYQCCLELLQLQVQLSTPEKKKHEQMKASVWIDLDVYADRLESLLEAIRKSHASIDLIDLYQHLINYQIRQINLGRAENDRKSRLYHLYQRFLDIPPIEKNPSNRIFIFKNMGSLLVSLGDTETLKRLIDEQSTNFNDHPSYVLDLVKGMSAFYHRQYEIAEDHFFNVLKSSILNFNLDARGYQALIQVLEAKILDPDFTQGHLHATYEQVETHLRQFHNYLMDLQKKHSNEHPTFQHIESFKNLVNFLRRLNNAVGSNSSPATQFAKAVDDLHQAQSIPMKDWLLKQLPKIDK